MTQKKETPAGKAEAIPADTKDSAPESAIVQALDADATASGCGTGEISNKLQFPIITFNDLVNYTPNPKDHIAGKGWIRRGGCLLFSGYTGIGKSVMTEQLAVCCATGTPFFGIPISKPVKVLYLQAENDMETLQRDFISIADHLDIDIQQLNSNLHIRHIFGVAGSNFVAQVALYAEEEGYDVVFVDPYQSFIDDDINSSRTPALFTSGMNHVMQQYHFGVVLVAHFAKPKKEEYQARQSTYSSAGSSALSNWARTSAEIYPVDGESRYRLVFGKNAERTQLVDEDSRLIRELYVEHSGNIKTPYWILSETQTMPAKEGKYDSRIIAMIKQGHSDAEIGNAIGINRSTVYRARKRLGLTNEN